MLVGFARSLKFLCFSRSGFAGLTTLLLFAGAGSVHDATAYGETRTLSFHHTHSRESLTVTFKRSGRYDEDGLRQLNHFLRDWRSQDKTTMDRSLFDILWEVYRDVDGKQPIQIISAYRSPSTNAMLRRRSSGVARSSQHMLGHAMDFFIPGVGLDKIRDAGLRLQRGGVGFYPTSGSPFVHLDTGSIRHWPRMTHDQLARVFPDGRTVHVPSNGGPLRNYQLAMADIQKRGNGGSNDSFMNKPSLLTSLFKGKQADDEDEGAPSATPAAAPRVAVAAAAPVPSPAAKPSVVSLMAAAVPAKSADPVPMPRVKPAEAASFQVAAAALPVAVPQPVAAPPRPPKSIPVAAKSESGPLTPADIINSRGFWDDIPAPKQATPAQVAAITARQALAAADSQSTASTSTFAAAMAYAPPAAERAGVVTASAPMPRSVRPASAGRNPMAVTEVTTVVSKGPQGRASNIVNATRMAAAPIRDNDVWMRVMILAPSATTSMSATAFGETDLTQMRAHFVKPLSAVTMAFSSDPQAGMVSDRFTGSATSKLPTTAFMRTASR